MGVSACPGGSNSEQGARGQCPAGCGALHPRHHHHPLSLPRQPDQTEARSLPGRQGQAGPLLRLTLPIASYSPYLTLKLIYLELKYLLHVRKSPRFTPAAFILSHPLLAGCMAGPHPGREGGTQRLSGQLRRPLRPRVRDCSLTTPCLGYLTAALQGTRDSLPHPPAHSPAHSPPLPHNPMGPSTQGSPLLPGALGSLPQLPSPSDYPAHPFPMVLSWPPGLGGGGDQKVGSE